MTNFLQLIADFLNKVDTGITTLITKATTAEQSVADAVTAATADAATIATLTAQVQTIQAKLDAATQ